MRVLLYGLGHGTGGFGILTGRSDSILVQLVAQSPDADAQGFGSTGAIALRGANRDEDVPFFNFCRALL